MARMWYMGSCVRGLHVRFITATVLNIIYYMQIYAICASPGKTDYVCAMAAEALQG